MLNDKYEYIDKPGKEVIPIKYDDADNFHEGFHEGYARVKLNGNWGYVDKTGRTYDLYLEPSNLHESIVNNFHVPMFSEFFLG